MNYAVYRRGGSSYNFNLSANILDLFLTKKHNTTLYRPCRIWQLQWSTDAISSPQIYTDYSENLARIF